MSQNSPSTARRPLRSDVITYVYRFFRQDGALLYVGVTNDLGTRFVAHQGKPWWSQASDSTVEAHGNRALALAAEAMAILEENPLHNVQRPSPDKAEQLRIRAIGVRASEISPYDPVAILAKAHDRIEELEADLRAVRKALTAVSVERDKLAAAARVTEARQARSSPEQQLIGRLREQLALCISERKLAEGRAEKAENRLKTAALKRIVAASRTRQSPP